MTRIPRIALLLVPVLLLGARASAAQTVPSPYEYIEPTQSVGAFAGWLWAEQSVALSDTTSVGLGPASAPLVGVRYQLRATGPLSVEAALAVSPSERPLARAQFVDDSLRVVGEDLGVSVPATLVMADAGLRFHLTGARTWRGLAPFVAGSAGIIADVRGTFDEEEEIEEDERFRFGPSFAVGAALGTDWFPTRTISLRIEGQGRLWRMTTPAGFFARSARQRSEWNPVAGITVGGAIHF